ncbi:MAG: calcium/sodium antiporter [Rhizobiales bacterium]|nr:calcium/sodium antiporter [Hyphomicrobiales bacterium]
MTALYTLAGVVLLMVGGDALVRGAITLSLKAGLSATLISMTVVAFGTSAPELVISVEAALSGSPDIALGNVVGSNIANTLLIVGVPALIISLDTGGKELRRNYALMLAATIVFSAFALTGYISRWAGYVLLACLVAALFYSYRKSEEEGGETLEAGDPLSGWKIAGMLLFGVIALPVGAHCLIEGARGVALYFGLSEAAIGLTIVALGTSLPELAASTAAAWRGRTEVALGNVIGSNMLNLLLVIGATASITPLVVSKPFLTVDIPLMIIITLLLAPFLIWHIRIGKRAALLLLACYAAFCVLALGDVTI